MPQRVKPWLVQLQREQRRAERELASGTEQSSQSVCLSNKKSRSPARATICISTLLSLSPLLSSACLLFFVKSSSPLMPHPPFYSRALVWMCLLLLLTTCNRPQTKASSASVTLSLSLSQ